ncbi:MAG: PIN domain-containing protein [Nitrospirae bacterium]|nr:PIN domain-containing protein [Nitrospirota bacterium]
MTKHLISLHNYSADVIVYATALEKDCKVITSDTHFKGLERVIFI